MSLLPIIKRCTTKNANSLYTRRTMALYTRRNIFKHSTVFNRGEYVPGRTVQFRQIQYCRVFQAEGECWPTPIGNSRKQVSGIKSHKWQTSISFHMEEKLVTVIPKTPASIDPNSDPTIPPRLVMLINKA